MCENVKYLDFGTSVLSLQILISSLISEDESLHILMCKIKSAYRVSIMNCSINIHVVLSSSL